MLILTARKFFRKNFIAMAIFPFIVLRDNDLRLNKRLINHERIHLRQQLELLIIPFYLWYIVEYWIKWFKYKDAHKAYLNISFEREAYQNDENLNYLKNRKWYSFFEYL